MTSRERVFAALAHKQPDRCPVDLLLEPATCNTLMQHFHVNSQQELLDIFESDMQFVFPDSKLPPVEVLPDGTWYNHAGAHVRRVKNDFCEYTDSSLHLFLFYGIMNSEIMLAYWNVNTR